MAHSRTWDGVQPRRGFGLAQNAESERGGAAGRGELGTNNAGLMRLSDLGSLAPRARAQAMARTWAS